MERREVLRRSGIGIASVATVSVAGCSNGGDGGTPTDGDDNGGDETPDGNNDDGDGVTDEGVANGEVVGIQVDGLEVVGLESAVSQSGGEDIFEIVVTIENVGQQATDLTGYGYNVTAYDASDQEIGSTSGSPTSADAGISPGETGTATVRPDVSGDPNDVVRYEFSIDCSSFIKQGVYCQ